MIIARWLRREWLRGLWIAVVVAYTIPFLVGLPEVVHEYAALTGPALSMGFQQWSTTELATALAQAGISIGMWTTLRMAADLITAAGFVGPGLLLFARRAGGGFGLFVSLFLVTFGLTSSESYDALTSVHPDLAGWMTILVSLPWLAFYLFFYTFPTGQFVPRWMAFAGPAFVGLLVVLFVFFPASSGLPLILVAFGSALYAQVYRFRRAATPTVRAQVKWVVFAVIVISLGEIIGQGLVPVLFPSLVTDPTLRLRYGMVLVLFVPLFLLIPASITIAVLRYRLWDIDVIIRRTLVYSLLSGLLALVYFGSVVVLESALRGLTGGGSQAAIVLSTLLIAALFGPLRGRVQRAIDQRFFRRKYDAARTLAAFGASVRDEVDLDALGQRLTGVVDEAMQPATVGLWVKAAPARLTPRAEVRETQ